MPGFFILRDRWKTGTDFMTPAQKGHYIELLLYQAEKGSIPSSEQDLMRFLGVHCVEEWQAIWNEGENCLSSKFELDENGRLFNLRLREDLESAEEIRRKRSEMGKRGGRPKANEKQTVKQNESKPESKTKATVKATVKANVKANGKAKAKQNKSSKTETYTETEIEKETETTTDSSCSELALPTSEPPETEFDFPCVGSGPKRFVLSRAKLDEYAESYPGVDVEAELRKARQWCRDNPKRRKTANGMLRFLAQWLSKSQNTTRGTPHRNGSSRYEANDGIPL